MSISPMKDLQCASLGREDAMIPDPTQKTFEVADALVASCRAGKLLEAGTTFWADGIVSIEPFEGDMGQLRGKEQVARKGTWWIAAHEVHSVEVGDPYVNGDQFIIRFTFDMTVRATGQRSSLDELAAYTVRDGRIVEEKFFVLKNYFEC